VLRRPRGRCREGAEAHAPSLARRPRGAGRHGGPAGRAREGPQAVAEAEAWVRQRPGDMRGYLTAARARSLNHEPAQALAHLERAIEVAPDSIAPRAMLARFYEHEKRNAEAEKAWAAAVARFPGHNGLAFDLANCRERLGDVAGAEAAVGDVLRREPENPTALNFL